MDAFRGHESSPDLVSPLVPEQSPDELDLKQGNRHDGAAGSDGPPMDVALIVRLCVRVPRAAHLEELLHDAGSMECASDVHQLPL